jgi:hypothetical protein
MPAPKRSVRKRAATDLHERVAALETLMELQVKTSETLAASVSEMKASLQKYQGFWGAVTLIGSAIWASFALFKDNILHLFNGSK